MIGGDVLNTFVVLFYTFNTDCPNGHPCTIGEVC